MRFLFLLFCCFFFFSQSINAVERPGWSFQGTLDGMLVIEDTIDSWLSGGLGKYRVGDSDDNAIIQSALALDYNISLQSGVALEAAYYSDPDNEIGLTQVFWHFKPLANKVLRSKYRAGIFHVPVSFENTAKLWHPIYSVTPSVINTWFGEELRAIGGEARWSWRFSRTSQHKISLIGSAFAANDTAGAMLAWRGWAAHNRQTLLGETFRLPALPVIQPGAPFESQAPEFEPFVEVDDRIGYFLGLDWVYGQKIHLRYLYYDNRGDPLSLENGQYAWDTRFHHIGLKAKLIQGWILVSQVIIGNTIMGPWAVDNDFMSGFLLISKKFNRHRVSARIETFEVDDQDFLSAIDPNNETGERLTLSYILQTNKKWFAAFEISRLRSNREYRVLFNEPQKLTEEQAFIKFRYQF